MKKNFRLDVSKEELKTLIDALHQKEGNEKLADKLAEKYLKQTDPKNNITQSELKLKEGIVRDEQMMKVIIHALSVLTGYPEENIHPDTVFPVSA